MSKDISIMTDNLFIFVFIIVYGIFLLSIIFSTIEISRYFYEILWLYGISFGVTISVLMIYHIYLIINILEYYFDNEG